MSTTYELDGTKYEVPDGTSMADVQKYIKSKSPQSFNPSDAIPKSKPPTPEGLQGPAPNSFRQMMTNMPASAYRSVENLITGGGQGPAQIQTDASGRKSLDVNAGPKALLNSIMHPIDTMVQDPIGATQALRGGLEAGKPLLNTPEFLEGATNAAAKQVRPVLSNFNLIHPARMLPDIYDAGVATLKGGRDAVAEANSMSGGPKPGNAPLAPKSYIDESQVTMRPMPGAAPAFQQLQGSGKIGEPLLTPSGPTMADLQPVPLSGPTQPARGPGAPGVSPDSFNSASPTQFRPVGPQMPTSSVAPTNAQNLAPAQPGISPVDIPPSPTAQPQPMPSQMRPIAQSGAQPDMSDMEQFAHGDDGTDNLDINKVYDEMGDRVKNERIQQAKAKDLDIAANLHKAGVTEEAWRNMEPKQRDTLVKAITHPEGHPRVGKAKYDSAPQDEGRIEHIARLLRISPD